MIKDTVVFHDALTARPALRSAVNGLAARPGEWPSLYDVRFGDGPIKCRYGTSSALGTIGSSASYRGSIACNFNGSQTMFVAVREGGSTRVYKSTDLATWTEITEGSGAYGSSRFSTDGKVKFEIVQDQHTRAMNYPTAATIPQDCLIFGNGSDYNRCYNYFYGGGGGSGFKTSIIEPIDTPESVRSANVTAFPFHTSNFGFALRDSGNTNYVASGANFTAADAGSSSSTNNRARLTIGTSTASGDSVIIEDSAAARQLLSGKTLLIGVDTSYGEFLSVVKIEVGNYAGSFTSAATIFDGQAGIGKVAIVPLDVTGAFLLSIDVSQFYTTSTYDAIKITHLGPAPSAAQTVDIWCVAPGPNWSTTEGSQYANPGGTKWALTWYNSGTRTESKPIILNPADTPEGITASGGNEIPDDYRKRKIPFTPLLDYAYRIYLVNPSTTNRDKGVDSMRIYRSRPSEDAPGQFSYEEYLLIENYELASWGGASWAYTGGTSADEKRAVYALGRESFINLSPPTAYHISMPKASAIQWASDRVFVGANQTQQTRVYVSGANHPFRFTEEPVGAADAPTVISLRADKVQGFASVASTSVGISRVFIFGETDVYAAGGFTSYDIPQVSRLGIPGTASPDSIVVGRDTVFYLDRERQVRRLDQSGTIALSLLAVDDNTKGIPGAYVDDVSACYVYDRYYMPFTPSGATTNTRILVYSDRYNAWESIDRPPLAFSAVLPFFSSADGRTKLVALAVQSGELKAFEYDHSTATQDIGSNITCGGTTYTLHAPDWGKLTMGRVAVACDQVTGGGAITLTRSYKPSAGTGASSITVGNGSGIERSTDSGSVTVTTGGNGGAVSLTWEASVRGGWSLYQIEADIEGRGELRQGKGS